MKIAKPFVILASLLLPLFPHLRKQLKKANMRTSPLELVARALYTGFLYGTLMGGLSFFFLSKARLSLLLMAPIFLSFFGLFFIVEFLKVNTAISKRRKEIDPEVIFIGRYLLIKIYAGRPLMNALIETAKSRGITASYIREIVHDISTGRPIEDALKNAVEYSPSEKLAKILFQLNNALKVGVDITQPLESILDELTKEEELEVKKYGKKLNSLVIFYMVAAIVIPSLGISLFMVVSNFLNLPIGLRGLLLITLLVALVQFVFISLFRSIRPMVDL